MFLKHKNEKGDEDQVKYVDKEKTDKTGENKDKEKKPYQKKEYQKRPYQKKDEKVLDEDGFEEVSSKKVKKSTGYNQGYKQGGYNQGFKKEYSNKNYNKDRKFNKEGETQEQQAQTVVPLSEGEPAQKKEIKEEPKQVKAEVSIPKAKGLKGLFN